MPALHSGSGNGNPNTSEASAVGAFVLVTVSLNIPWIAFKACLKTALYLPRCRNAVKPQDYELQQRILTMLVSKNTNGYYYRMLLAGLTLSF